MDVERSSPERPLAAYGAIMAVYSLAFVGPLALAARRGALPKRPSFADLALVGVGTYKLSRLDRVRPEEYRRVTEVTYLGSVWGTMAALRYMKPRDRGVIVQVAAGLAALGRFSKNGK